MGMYDSVMVKCPCGAEVEFQSKAGDCILKYHDPRDVPSEIADDLNGKIKRCECGRDVTLFVHCAIIPIISED